MPFPWLNLYVALKLSKDLHALVIKTLPLLLGPSEFAHNGTRVPCGESLGDGNFGIVMSVRHRDAEVFAAKLVEVGVPHRGPFVAYSAPGPFVAEPALHTQISDDAAILVLSKSCKSEAVTRVKKSFQLCGQKYHVEKSLGEGRFEKVLPAPWPKVPCGKVIG